MSRPVASLPLARSCALLLAATAVGLASGCGGSGGSSTSPGVSGGGLRLAQVHFGKLIDVYGLRVTAAGTTVELYQRDVLAGTDIKDERPSNSSKRDEEILYDFISADPDNLQPRLLITRAIGSAEFAAAFDAIDDQLRLIQPAAFGQNTATTPFSVVARDAAVRLTFTEDLRVSDDFFVERGSSGQVIGLKNTEAVQLLEISGDPSQAGGLRQISTRVVPRGNVLILDPVLLATEGLQYQTRNNAAGMPESPNQSGANIRIALALEGPLAIPGLRPDRVGSLNGANLAGGNSVIRDCRSGNRNDNTPELSQGFLRDPVPPRIVGQLLMYLERVDPIDQVTQLVTLYKNGLDHEIDRGDVLRLMVDNTGVPAAVTEVTVDPVDDAEQPSVQHVRAIVRRVIQPDPAGNPLDVFAQWDPSEDPAGGNLFWQQNSGIPAYPQTQQQLGPWLVQYAPRAVLVAEFTAERIASSGQPYGDDPRYFVNFSPTPLPDPNGTPSPPNENVSPFAGAIVRFTKPVDLKTVRGVDSFFFATRDVLDAAEISNFQLARGIDPATFVHAKYVTPHLVAAQTFDEDGSQTSIRLQPRLGFYLDEDMRSADEGVPFAQKQFCYFLHLVGGKDGIRDLSGNELDFQSQVTIRGAIGIKFSLDTRRSPSGAPQFSDNLVVTVARRFAHVDEDEQPSYYAPGEQLAVGQPVVERPEAYNLPDVFGAVVYLPDGTVSGRPTTRVRKMVDDLNQVAPPPQLTPDQYCPSAIGTEPQIATASASARFGSPLQNPLNPFGCRLQTVWREIDMSLSKTDAIDFNLDVEQLFWAPYQAGTISFDEFDRISLFLGHSEGRPEPCIGASSALPTLPGSGLQQRFDDNYVYSPSIAGGKENASVPHVAFTDQSLTILSAYAVNEPNGVYRYLPLPTFQEPYFVWRDERLNVQGAGAGVGQDTEPAGAGGGANFAPYILSPFLTGRGRYVTAVGGVLQINNGAWDNRRNSYIAVKTRTDPYTGGLVGSIALPLLADFWTYPDDGNLPAGNPFRASGANGWQISLALTSAAQPNFRVYSAGGLVQGQPKLVDPSTSEWALASGGYTPSGTKTSFGDNSVFWIMADYLKRLSVMTAGFVDISDPHRIITLPAADPRLGPFDAAKRPPNSLPTFDYYFEPPLQTLPGGTAVVPEFRAAGIIDPIESSVQRSGPWPAAINNYVVPDAVNFALDPLKAGDAHIRKYDDRKYGGVARNWWTYNYNRHVTPYTTDLNQLMDARFTSSIASAGESFLPQDVRYFSWRLIFLNNVDANPPVTPQIDSFVVAYRFESK